MAESIVATATNVKFASACSFQIDSGKKVSPATVSVSTGSVVLTQEENGSCEKLEYRTIALHAISREDLCIYMQRMQPTSEEEAVSEIRIFLPKEEDLEPMFSALCQCSALHPDPDEEEDAPVFGGGGDGFDWDSVFTGKEEE